MFLTSRFHSFQPTKLYSQFILGRPCTLSGQGCEDELPPMIRDKNLPNGSQQRRPALLDQTSRSSGCSSSSSSWSSATSTTRGRRRFRRPRRKEAIHVCKKTCSKTAALVPPTSIPIASEIYIPNRCFRHEIDGGDNESVSSISDMGEDDIEWETLRYPWYSCRD